MMEKTADEEKNMFVRNPLAAQLVVPTSMLNRNWKCFVIYIVGYYLLVVYFLLQYSPNIVKYINDLRNPKQCSTDSDVCEYVTYCSEYSLSTTNHRTRDMLFAAGFGILIVQIMRMILILLKDSRSNYLSIYFASIIVMLIKFSAEYLNISQIISIQCMDVIGVTIPSLFIIEWHITVPAMLYLVVSLDVNKTALAPVDYRILISGAYMIIASMMSNLVTSKIMGGILIASSIVSLMNLSWSLFADCRSKLKYFLSEKDLALLDPQQYIQLSILTRRLECTYLLISTFPFFGLIYISQYANVINIETSTTLFHFLNILVNVVLNIVICESHLETLNPGEYNLIIEKKARDVKRAFIRYIFHEVRSPLNCILMGLHSLIKDEELRKSLGNSKSGSNMYEILHVMKESSLNLGETMNDVLNLHKLEEESLHLKLRPFEMLSITKAIENNCADAVGDKSLDLKIIYKQGMPLMIFADEALLKHAIMNIVSNACTSTSNTGSIRVLVDTTNNKQDLVIKIFDNGTAIRQSDIDTLFLPYAIINSLIKRQERAHGIGLAVASDIIKLHGGTIQYDAINNQHIYGMDPNGVFIILLPIRSRTSDYLGVETVVDVLEVKSKPCSVESINNNSNISNSTKSRLHFLIVDDVKSNRKILQMLMAKRNIQADVAENGLDAVEMVGKDPQKYQIIFMDNMMPVMTGVEATKAIRLAGYRGVIMGLTGNTFETDIEEFESAGATLVLPKPLNHHHLDNLLSLLNANKIENAAPSMDQIKQIFKDVY